MENGIEVIRFLASFVDYTGKEHENYIDDVYQINDAI